MLSGDIIYFFVLCRQRTTGFYLKLLTIINLVYNTDFVTAVTKACSTATASSHT